MPGKSHGQRSLAGYSPWGLKESATTEQLGMHTCWEDGHYIEMFSLGHTLNEHLLCVQGITLGTGNAKTIKTQCLIVKELSFVLEGDAQDDVKSLQSCLTLCDPMDWSPPGSSVHGILQAKILLQGIFPSQGSNPCLLCLLHWQAGSLPLAPPGKPWSDCG